jgi:enolase
MPNIQALYAREVLDSRGNPTIEAVVTLTSGIQGSAMVPSGATTGTREALELRDGGTRYLGRGVLNNVAMICGEIQSALLDREVGDQASIDACLIALDGTPNKSRLGANTLLAVSMAVARAAAGAKALPLYQHLHETQDWVLPVPQMNIINGGGHADNTIDIQEFMILPLSAPNFKEALRYGVEIFHTLKSLLKRGGHSTGIGDEGGFAPNLPSHAAAIELILSAINRAGLKPGVDVYLGLDVASSELYQAGHYRLNSEQRILTTTEFVAYLEDLVLQYPIISIEDGMAEDDWAGWQHLTERLGHQVQLVGDDVFVTNTAILTRGIQEHIANSALIKLNQIGTLTETIAAIRLAKHAGYSTVVSHRSGETEDAFIADFAVAMGVGQIKTGSLCRSERVAKYNQLLRIEDALGAQAQYAGRAAFKRWLV